MSKLGWVAFAAFAAFGGLGACTGGDDPSAPRTYGFGPYTVQPEEEVSDQCVQITLGNDDYVFVNSVELTTGPGFHHSNWLFVPESTFPGPHFDGKNSSADDGTYTCSDRNFDQAIGAIFGGVLFAQSTQSAHEVQAFPAGHVVAIPPHSKLVSTIHLLNNSDNALTVNPTIKLTPLAPSDVTTRLSGISFQNHALGLPPNKRSRFSLECNLLADDQPQNPKPSWPAVDFKIFYAVAHYHALGTGLTVEAITSDGTATPVFSTGGHAGDSLGSPLDPAFDMTGYSRIRFSCDYYNTTSTTVGWGLGRQEMCVFLAFTDSPFNWGGGVVLDDPPGDPVDVNGTMSYSHPCMVFANDASR